NAGRPLVLEGGLDWKPMSLSPGDMDFLNAKHAAAREIALAFGVPPMLLAIPGDNTYSNYQEANRVFWRQSVLPLAGRIACALTHWLSPVFGDGLMLAADTDRIEALSPDRAALWERVSKAPFLSVNEKRLATGYGPVEGGDVFHPPQ
ncbi:MAG: phage portal protein, partial [Pseudolabrys sp.]